MIRCSRSGFFFVTYMHQKKITTTKNNKMKIKCTPSLLTLLLIINFSCSSPEKKCADFKTGNFKYSDPQYQNFKIVRSGSTQTEMDSVTGLEIQGDVKWTSDCSYTLKYTKVNNPAYSSVVDKEINVEIIKISDNKITCKSESSDGTTEVELEKID